MIFIQSRIGQDEKMIPRMGQIVYNSCANKLVQPFCNQFPRPDYLRNTHTTALDVADE